MAVVIFLDCREICGGSDSDLRGCKYIHLPRNPVVYKGHGGTGGLSAL